MLSASEDRLLLSLRESSNDAYVEVVRFGKGSCRIQLPPLLEKGALRLYHSVFADDYAAKRSIVFLMVCSAETTVYAYELKDEVTSIS